MIPTVSLRSYDVVHLSPVRGRLHESVQLLGHEVLGSCCGGRVLLSSLLAGGESRGCDLWRLRCAGQRSANRRKTDARVSEFRAKAGVNCPLSYSSSGWQGQRGVGEESCRMHGGRDAAVSEVGVKLC